MVREINFFFFIENYKNVFILESCYQENSQSSLVSLIIFLVAISILRIIIILYSLI